MSPTAKSSQISNGTSSFLTKEGKKEREKERKKERKKEREKERKKERKKEKKEEEEEKGSVILQRLLTYFASVAVSSLLFCQCCCFLAVVPVVDAVFRCIVNFLLCEREH